MRGGIFADRGPATDVVVLIVAVAMLIGGMWPYALLLVGVILVEAAVMAVFPDPVPGPSAGVGRGQPRATRL